MAKKKITIWSLLGKTGVKMGVNKYNKTVVDEVRMMLFIIWNWLLATCKLYISNTEPKKFRYNPKTIVQ